MSHNPSERAFKIELLHQRSLDAERTREAAADAISQRYAIKSKAEAVAYHAHPLLGSRLAECTRTVLAVPDRSADKIFGSPDDIKFRSSMTLFDAADAGGGPYRNALDRFYAGERDAATLAVLDRWRAAG